MPDQYPSDDVCAHTGQAPIEMRTEDDCMICALAMFAGMDYDAVVAAAQAEHPEFPTGGPMTHSVLRVIASHRGIALLSGIYMLWEHPAIIGVLSATIPNCGHAVLWDGRRIIDPHPTVKVDLAYVQAHAMEFTQRASDLAALVVHNHGVAPATQIASLEEFW